MKAAVTLEATQREATNKGSSRALRRAGKIPAIVYAKGTGNVTFSLPENILSREYLRGGFFNKVIELKTEKDSIFALPKDIQLHPVSDKIQHVDFYQIKEDSTVTVQVPVHFLNIERCKGVKRGGTLNVVRHTLELVCNVQNIPSFIEADIKDMQIGDSLHISAIELPEGVTPAITDRDFTIATIAGRGGKSASEESAEGEGEAAEGEAKEGEAKEAKKEE
ncbi:MAG: 50S ribosomal protein L25/general stress protein Ctc [Rickettsiales bacterium]|nr:50S ribosomal protein L25/general stress protein Ctc [Rickettsiales bacterium]